MNLSEILSYCIGVLAVNQRGNSLSPDQYNILLKAVNNEYFDNEVNKLFQMGQVPTPLKKDLLLNNPLSKFTSSVTYAGGNSFTIPTDTGRLWTATATKSGALVPVDIYTEQQMASLRTSVLNVDFDKNPGAVVRGNNLVVYGDGITALELVYLIFPSTPFYDYAVDSNDNIIFIQADWFLYGTATPYYFDIYRWDNGSFTLYSNVYYSRFAGVAGTTYSPLTVELEWGELYHIVFANRILEKLGLTIRDQFAFQVAQMAEKKDAQ